MEKKWYQKDWGIITLLIFFFPVGLYLVWKKSDWSKKNKVIATICIIVLIGLGQTDLGQTSYSSNNSSNNSSSIFGRYDDFSGWRNGYTGFVDVNEGNWRAIIYYNGRTESSFSGKTSGSDLMDEYGMNRVGYIQNGTAYIVYMGGWVEIGK